MSKVVKRVLEGEALDLGTPPMPADEARALLVKVRAVQDELVKIVLALYRGRAWTGLGYASWNEMVDAEQIVTNLPRLERQKAVAELNAGGLSTRAIGAALRVNHTTVGKDLRAGGGKAPPASTGLDGKTYSAHPPRKKTPAPELPPEPQPRTTEADWEPLLEKYLAEVPLGRFSDAQWIVGCTESWLHAWTQQNQFDWPPEYIDDVEETWRDAQKIMERLWAYSPDVVALVVSQADYLRVTQWRR